MRGSSLNRLPPEETREEIIERIRGKIQEMKNDERQKREEAEHKTKGVKKADLFLANVIRAIYIDLEERLLRDSPSLFKKRPQAPLKERIVKGRVSKRKNANLKDANLKNAPEIKPRKTFKERKAKGSQGLSQESSRESTREFFKQQSRAKRELEEMARDPKAFEEKMKRLEKEELEGALSGAFGNFHINLPPPGYTRPLPEYIPTPALPNLMPFKAMSDPGRKHLKHSLSKKARSAKARSANQVSRGRKTPDWAKREWAKRKKRRPAPVRTRKSRPKRVSQYTE